MRILLLEHPREISGVHFDDIANTPPRSSLMTGYACGALVRAGFEAEIVDAVRMGLQETLDRLMHRPLPDFLAVHAVYCRETTESLFRMLSDLRALGFDAPICLYGFFPGLAWKEVLEFCEAVDYVVVGEPEETIVELARKERQKEALVSSGMKGIAFRVNGEAVFSGARAPIESPDELAFPLRPSLESEGHPAKELVCLPRLKGCFPFRLGATSYILPDEILPNVKFLGQYLDEIELVLFESGSESNLPGEGEVREMARVASDLDLTYNVHLPSDLFFGEPDRALRRRFCETALSFYERTLPLSPSCYVLHLDSRKADGTVEPDVSAWGDRVFDSLRIMESKGMDPGKVAVENLEFPLQRIQPFVQAFNLSMCLDIGHLLRYGHDVAEQTTLFFDKITMVHLHGVHNGKDHTGINHVAEAEWGTIRGFLEGYRGGLSLEVFSLKNLAASCNRMLEMVRKDK